MPCPSLSKSKIALGLFHTVLLFDQSPKSFAQATVVRNAKLKDCPNYERTLESREIAVFNHLNPVPPSLCHVM